VDRYYVTLRDILEKSNGLSYQKLHRAVAALKEAGLIKPWHGVNNELRLTLDGERVLRRLIGILKNGTALQNAVLILKLELLQEEKERLEEENRRLHALVEVKPPWWKRVISLWHRIRPWGKAHRSQRQAG
jgi:hypothetical protein